MIELLSFNFDVIFFKKEECVSFEVCDFFCVMNKIYCDWGYWVLICLLKWWKELKFNYGCILRFKLKFCKERVI